MLNEGDYRSPSTEQEDDLKRGHNDQNRTSSPCSSNGSDDEESHFEDPRHIEKENEEAENPEKLNDTEPAQNVDKDVLTQIDQEVNKLTDPKAIESPFKIPVRRKLRMPAFDFSRQVSHVLVTDLKSNPQKNCGKCIEYEERICNLETENEQHKVEFESLTVECSEKKRIHKHLATQYNKLETQYNSLSDDYNYLWKHSEEIKYQLNKIVEKWPVVESDDEGNSKDNTSVRKTNVPFSLPSTSGNSSCVHSNTFVKKTKVPVDTQKMSAKTSDDEPRPRTEWRKRRSPSYSTEDSIEPPSKKKSSLEPAESNTKDSYYDLPRYGLTRECIRNVCQEKMQRFKATGFSKIVRHYFEILFDSEIVLYCSAVGTQKEAKDGKARPPLDENKRSAIYSITQMAGFTKKTFSDLNSTLNNILCQERRNAGVSETYDGTMYSEVQEYNMKEEEAAQKLEKRKDKKSKDKSSRKSSRSNK